ncbi:hypothetical protein TcasGA2_TC015262 [Tribolium castaneum]|uniref:Ionotropic glutamate receptor C-terminal domain-containing protein n=1 Tax=Tribolium castaneum TaxID=7070 RepID=D2A522_TRICA|nr:hypothetical protein TcasGA2_TC015262 [Tribolium castaneum]
MSPLIFAFLISLASSTHYKNFQITNTPKKETNILTEILQKYADFYLIVHVDNVTQRYAYEILSKSPTFTTIYNHDMPRGKNMTRPLTHQCLNLIVFTKPEKFLFYLNSEVNVHPHDVLIFVTSSSKTFENVAIWKNLSQSGRNIIIEFASQVTLYTICFYCGKSTGKLILYQNETHNFDLFPNDFHDFHNHVLKVVYIDYFPYIYCTQKNKSGAETTCNEAFGAEYLLLETLSRKHNFELIEAPNCSYDEFIEGLRSGYYDLGIGGFSVTESRRHVLKFSEVLRLEDMAFVFIYKRPLLKRLAIGDQFVSPKIWAGVMMVLCVMASVLFLVVKYCGLEVKASFWRIAWMLLQSSYEQPVRLKQILGFRPQLTFLILLSSWWLFIMVTNVDFKSRMTAYMVYNPEPPTTLQELLSEGYHFVVDKTKYNSYLSIFVKEEQLLIMNNPNTVEKEHLCELASYIESNPAIIAGEVAVNLYHTKIYCTEYYTKPPESIDRFTTKVFNAIPHGWALGKGAPFVHVVDKAIRQATSGEQFIF